MKKEKKTKTIRFAFSCTVDATHHIIQLTLTSILWVASILDFLNFILIELQAIKILPLVIETRI